MVSIGFADHMGRVLFTVCVGDRQPPPAKTFFDPGKTLISLYIIFENKYIYVSTCLLLSEKYEIITIAIFNLTHFSLVGEEWFTFNFWFTPPSLFANISELA